MMESHLAAQTSAVPGRDFVHVPEMRQQPNHSGAGVMQAKSIHSRHHSSSGAHVKNQHSYSSQQHPHNSSSGKAQNSNSRNHATPNVGGPNQNSSSKKGSRRRVGSMSKDYAQVASAANCTPLSLDEQFKASGSGQKHGAQN